MLRRPMTPKPAKCKHCRQRLTKLGEKLHPACIDPWLSANREKLRAKTDQRIKRMAKEARKQERAEDRATREKQKGLPQLHKEAREAVHEFIRLRDAHLPCISCGAPPPDLSDLHAGRDAGHYRSVGSAPQHRYNLMNINAQCVHCNQHLAGNPIAYRFGMLAKYGEAATLALELDNAAHKWTRAEVRGIRDEYRAKTKALKAKNA
jgi:Bacteriophage Lambda NinG protein